MKLRRTLVLLAALMSASCSGQVVMTPMSPEAINSNYSGSNSSPPKDIKGIIVYRAIPLVEVDELTQITIPKAGDTPASVSNDCNSQLVRKVVSVPDYEHPYVLHYDHGLLESYTFGATLNADGVLLTINSVSTPDQGKTLQNLASTASTAAGIPKTMGLNDASKAPCTGSSVFIGYEHLPASNKILEWNTTKP